VTTDWLTAAAMIVSGAIVGFMIVYSMKRGAARCDAGVQDLEAKRDALIAALRAEPNESERARLEREAAEVLRKLDGMPAGRSVPTAGPRSAATRPATSSAALKGFLWGAFSVAALAGIGWFVMQSAKPRAEDQPLTGSALAAPMQAGQASQASDPALRQLEEKVKAQPDDLALRDALAKAYLDRENLMAVFEQTKVVLERAPDDARALTYQALVRIAMGQSGTAEEMLHRAVKSDPSSLDAYVGLAFVDLQMGKATEAEAAIREAARRHPEEQARLMDVFGKMRAQIRPTGSAASQAAAPASGAPEAAFAAPQAAPAGPVVHVTLQLAPGTVASPSGVIFVIARPAGQTAGPPAAAKRLAVGAFPMSVDISAADSMMGQPLPDTMRIEARIDSDGNPLTRDPKDPSATQDGVRAGSSVTLVLRAH
jgi:tetratricopeptide (TPR) repeat protein